MITEFETILLSLSKEKVEFILTGGFAVNFHGYNRSTSDLDIWVKPVESNKQKIINVLLQLGYSKEAEIEINKLNFNKPFVFSLGEEPLDIDIFNHISGVKYDEADMNKIEFKITDELKVYFISLNDLIINKMISGRPQDVADVANLQQINNLKKK